MEKFKKFILVGLLLGSLVSCNKNIDSSQGTTNNQIKNGTETAKILLANERLSEESLASGGNIFTSGKKAFQRIIDETQKYTRKFANKDKKEKFEIDGNTYKWYAGDDYSNFLDFFNSYAINIEHFANNGSNLIDETKKNIRVVNKWVDVGEHEILLIVEEDSEMILSRTDSQYEFCKRYLNDEGLNVFEMFISNQETNYQSRMTYIPNLRYEYTSKQNDATLFIIADKEKGYWDIMTTNGTYEETNDTSFTNLVMKDEAIYISNYLVTNDGIETNDFKLVSSDGSSDLFLNVGTQIEIFTTGVIGLSHLEITTTEDRIYNLTENNYEDPENIYDYDLFSNGEGEDKSYFTLGTSSVTAVFDNGKRLDEGDVLYDGKINVGLISVHPIGGIDLYGSIVLYFEDHDIDNKLTYLKKFLDDYGASLKGDYDKIVASSKYASKDADNFGKYYVWNDYHINTPSGVTSAINDELGKIYAMVNLYNTYKDYETISLDNQEQMEKNYYFADFNIDNNGTITNDGFIISIEDLKVSISDLTLFVKNTQYQVEVALGLENNGSYTHLYHLENSSDEAFTYNGEKKLELSLNTQVEIPNIEEGVYTLLAYIATEEEGIRVSKPVSLSSSNIVENSRSNEGLINRIYSESNNIKLESIKDENIYINLSGTYDYDSLYYELEKCAYEYGQTTGDKIEIENNETWTPIEENGEIISGTYRLRYEKNGSDAYIIAVVEIVNNEEIIEE